ncbi:hypothetical protein LCGC14_1977130 [marine sediment metagenome]|uniref:Uncharacterized protein n=1 Tax=marine sediment metagenome TaxID=412755 RepID=A0A0F9FAA5_9ZZZZ
MTTRQLTTACLTETMAKLADALNTRQLASYGLSGLMAIVSRRILATDEATYLTVVAEWRALSGSRARLPGGCRAHHIAV